MIWKVWLKETNCNHALPKSALGVAQLLTPFTLWPRLVSAILMMVDFILDNNLIENSIRPVALGKKKLFVRRVT